jgi:hypothetical protein
MLRVDGLLLCVLLVLERRMQRKQQRIAIFTLCTLLLKDTEVYLLGICVWSCPLKCAKPYSFTDHGCLPSAVRHHPTQYVHRPEVCAKLAAREPQLAVF